MNLPERAETLVELLEHSVGWPQAVVGLLDRRENYETRRIHEILHDARVTAAGLAAAGVRAGDRVSVILPTSHEFLDVFFGIQMVGAIPCPMYPPVRLGKMDEYVKRTCHMLEAIGARHIVTDRRCSRLLGRVVDATRGGVEGLLDVADLDGFSPIEPCDLDPDSVAFVQFSSGTTREPAAVQLTHRQILANVEAIKDALPEEALVGGGCVSWLPLYHDMGLIGCMLTTIRCARELTLIPPEVFLAKPAIWFRAIDRFSARVTTAPNFAFGRCVDKIDLADVSDLDLSSWRVAMNGAEPVAASVLEEFADKFEAIGFDRNALKPVYGLSEAALAVTFSDGVHAPRFDRDELAKGTAEPDEDGVAIVSVGKPLDGFDVSIRDDQGGELRANRVGRIWIRGPSLMLGYLNRPSPFREDGWLDTGDLGFFDGDELFVCGRSKDVVIVKGRNHHPSEIEDAIGNVEGVRTGCVVVASDVAQSGEEVIALVEVREHRTNLVDACRAAARSAAGVTPDRVVLLEPGTLPRTSSGKIRRARAIELWRENALEAPQSVGPLHVGVEMARSYFGYWRASR